MAGNWICWTWMMAIPWLHTWKRKGSFSVSPDLKKVLESEFSLLKELIAAHTELIARLRQMEMEPVLDEVEKSLHSFMNSKPC